MCTSSNKEIKQFASLIFVFEYNKIFSNCLFYEITIFLILGLNFGTIFRHKSNHVFVYSN